MTGLFYGCAVVTGLSGSPDSTPDWSPWDLWWTKWQWDWFSSTYFGFPLSVSFHQCFRLIHSPTTDTIIQQLRAPLNTRSKTKVTFRSTSTSSFSWKSVNSYEFRILSNGITSILNFVKIVHLVQNSQRGTHKQHRDLASRRSFPIDNDITIIKTNSSELKANGIIPQNYYSS